MLAMAEIQKHYGVREAAKLLDISERTLWNWIKSERIQAVKVVGTKIIRIPASELARLGFRTKDEGGGNE